MFIFTLFIVFIFHIIIMYQSNAIKSFPKIIAIGKNYMKHVKEMGGT